MLAWIKPYRSTSTGFDRLTPEFSFYCTETRVINGDLGEAAVFRFISPRDEVGADALAAHLTSARAQVAASRATSLNVTRWAINVVQDVPPVDFPFKAIEEIWFTSPDQATKALLDPAMAVLANRLDDIIDEPATVTILTRPVHRWPKG